jgi:hypothetical protein
MTATNSEVGVSYHTKREQTQNEDSCEIYLGYEQEEAMLLRTLSVCGSLSIIIERKREASEMLESCQSINRACSINFESKLGYV